MSSTPRLFVSACVWVAFAVVGIGCGATAGPLRAAQLPSAPPTTFAGSVQYEARTATPSGASAALELRPVRHALVVALARESTVVGEARTNDDGRFELVAPADATAIAVVASARTPEGLAVDVTEDGAGRSPHRLLVAIERGRAQSMDIVARDEGAGHAGAFHILDTTLTGAQAVYRWTGRVLPPLFTFWGRGVTTTWSFYRGERPEGSGRYGLELLGGEPGRQMTTDTDEHDESIILHEYGHFVMDQLSTDSSAGGMHPSGHLLEPGLAWEEGRASWFSAVVLGQPWYLDTIGVEPNGALRVAHDLERGLPGPRGLGSEQGVAEILWDLTDGAGGIEDTDGDPVALGPARVLQLMIELGTVEGAFPAIDSFLAHVVASGAATEEDVRELLVRGGHPVALLPDPPRLWPRELTIPGRVGAKIDGLTNPAPSGGPNRPQNGYDAVHVYKVHVPTRARLSAELRIFGTGRGADHHDLDLELRDIRANSLAASRGETPVERLSLRVEPGWYIVYVRDGGAGNRVGYDLQVWFDPE